jgi:enamine deaminase RidA (YjgF/YER057c/UK114 family)
MPAATKIVSATVYLADIATFADMNLAWDAWAPGNPPARATVGAARRVGLSGGIQVIAARN